MKFTDKITNKEFTVVRLNESPKVLISDALFVRIHKYHVLHNDLEWSGQLLFKTNTAKITEVKNMVIHAEEFIPMDLGNAVATDINFKGGHQDATEYIPDFWDDFRIEDPTQAINSGCIHSHHNMSTFFSSVDQPSLLESTSSALQFMYVSLIVNYETMWHDFKGRWKCRVAFRTSELKDGQHAFITNGEVTTTMSEPTIAYADCIVDHKFKHDREDLAVKRYKELMPAFHSRYQHEIFISSEFLGKVFELMSDGKIKDSSTSVFLEWMSQFLGIEDWFIDSFLNAIDAALEMNVKPFPQFDGYKFEDGHIHMLVIEELAKRLEVKHKAGEYKSTVLMIALELKKL